MYLDRCCDGEFGFVISRILSIFDTNVDLKFVIFFYFEFTFDVCLTKFRDEDFGFVIGGKLFTI